MLESELLNSLLIRSDGSALDGNLAFLGGFGRVNSNLIIGGISVLDGQVIILDVEVKIWVDMLIDKNESDIFNSILEITENYKKMIP